jgi:hypothetical protein
MKLRRGEPLAAFIKPLHEAEKVKLGAVGKGVVGRAHAVTGSTDSLKITSTAPKLSGRTARTRGGAVPANDSIGDG